MYSSGTAQPVRVPVLVTMAADSSTKPLVSGYRHGRVPRAVREQQLLDLAERLFIENGYDSFSIEDLCRAARISRPIVYEHFGSKEGLYLACLRRIRAEFEDTLINATIGGSDRGEQLERGADAESVLAAAHAISAIGEQLGRWWLRNPDIPRARIVGYYRDFCLGGLTGLLEQPEQ
jgi:AcrR family transcriptional regulator